MPATTAVPLQPQPWRHAHCASAQKENCPPSSGLSPSSQQTAETPCKAPEQSVRSVQTPTKISQGAARSTADSLTNAQMHQWGFEVKNTFIHYGSPLKTVSVVTPPKTVPSNFAPEVVLLEQMPQRLRTPAAVFHSAATPSTCGGSALAGGAERRWSEYPCAGTAGPETQRRWSDYPIGGTAVYLAPPAPPPAAPMPAAGGPTSSSTLLRLSDFLPSPTASACLTSTNTTAGVVAPTHTQALSSVSGSWQQPGAYVETGMPPVPPLPGPPCQAPSGIALDAAVAHATMPPPPPPPPQFSAFDTMVGMQVPTANYDPLQFITGEAPTMTSGATMSQMSGVTMSYDHSRMAHMQPQMPLQLPPQQPPSLALEQTFHLSGHCGGISPTFGGPSPTATGMFSMGPTMTVSSPMSMGASTPMGGMVGTGPACGSITAEGCLGPFCMGNTVPGTCATGTLPTNSIYDQRQTVSISAGHFPEPSSVQATLGHQQTDTSPRLGSTAPDVIALDLAWM